MTRTEVNVEHVRQMVGSDCQLTVQLIAIAKFTGHKVGQCLEDSH